MPIYEYGCPNCGHKIEIMQKISDPPVSECKRCHASMKKLISQSTFHLKGTGWYVTDYASKSNHAPKKQNKAASKTKAKPSLDGTNTKSASTTPEKA
jgi:putative FmdB family regulatory protein